MTRGPHFLWGQQTTFLVKVVCCLHCSGGSNDLNTLNLNILEFCLILCICGHLQITNCRDLPVVSLHIPVKFQQKYLHLKDLNLLQACQWLLICKAEVSRVRIHGHKVWHLKPLGSRNVLPHLFRSLWRVHSPSDRCAKCPPKPSLQHVSLRARI